MTDVLNDLREQARAAIDALAREYAARRDADTAFDADGYFFDLRRMVEARALTLKLVKQDGARGGGGQDEA
jgi:hypothetical protein